MISNPSLNLCSSPPLLLPELSMEKPFSPKPTNGYLRFLFLVLFLTFFSAFPVSSAPSSSIHDLLRHHGLPGGLLPKGVKSFDLDEETGLLEVNLDQPCYAKYDNMAYFDQVVRGNLSYGELNGVVGLSQEELFLWLPVRGIMVSDRASGVILFDIGVAHKQLSVSLFEVPPDCRPVGGEGVEGEGDGLTRSDHHYVIPPVLKWIPGRKARGSQQQG